MEMMLRNKGSNIPPLVKGKRLPSGWPDDGPGRSRSQIGRRSRRRRQVGREEAFSSRTRRAPINKAGNG